MREPPATIEGLKAELEVLRSREAEILADAVEMREAGAPAERIRAMTAKAEIMRPRIRELERQIHKAQEH